MNGIFDSQLINLLGFAVGIVLYALLLTMTVRHPVRENERNRIDRWLLSTAILGLLWNVGELIELIVRDFGYVERAPILEAAAYSALGFLPAVIVHLTWQSADGKKLAARITTIFSYLLSATAAIWHLTDSIFFKTAPAAAALQILTVGYLVILALLIVFAYRQTVARKTVLAAALAVFAISAFHLSRPHGINGFFLIEIVGHQASLPLVLAILFQDFRFAFADLFLKRALSLLLLTLAVCGLYSFVAVPLITLHRAHAATDSQPVFILLGLWIVTALIYGTLHRLAIWLVDKIILRRADYEILRRQIAADIERSETTEIILETVCRTLAAALTARAANWSEVLPRTNNAQQISVVNLSSGGAEIDVPTVETPFYQIALADFAGARRLLSDEIEMLEDAAVMAARRIDALRVTHERCEQQFREQEIGKLVSEAELRALRAQLNPHFLFNALTTIGYLINVAPDKAFQTLMQLTQLLRGVLRTAGEFSTLGEELKLIESYLEIERARFEERLQVRIEIAPDLLGLRVPSLILQPIVENAVKHGIAPKKSGGEVFIFAKIADGKLILIVADTGAGVNLAKLREQQNLGVGLSSVENRLRSYFQDQAEMTISPGDEAGTVVKVVLPVNANHFYEARK